jgi:hypothetical protein
LPSAIRPEELNLPESPFTGTPFQQVENPRVRKADYSDMSRKSVFSDDPLNEAQLTLDECFGLLSPVE